MRLSGPGAVGVSHKHNLREVLEALETSGGGGSGGGGPIFVATTNNALSQVISQCPPERGTDLVFLQNGMLLPLLAHHGLADNTQALLYLSATAGGELTDGGRTVACGRWADALAATLARGGAACRSVGRAEFLALMVDKLLWASIYWVLSAALGGLPVGQLARQHSAAAAELAAELLPLAQAYLVAAEHGGGGSGGGGSSSSSSSSSGLPGSAAGGLWLPPGSTEQVAALTVEGVCQSMADYSLSIPAAVPSRAMALAELEWRNGWFLGQARTPAHVEWLARAGVEA